MRFDYVNCNICGTNKTRPFGKRKSLENNANLETNIVQCASCGLLYPDPMPKQDNREIQNNFKNVEEYFPGPISEGHMKKCEKRMRIIEKIKPNKGNLLDAGCGRGELVYVAGKRNWRATGIEISEDFARYAREKFNITVLVGDINHLELRRETFDVACLNSVIQYVRDPLNCLKEINALLKKDGVLYIEVRNEDALVFKIGDFFLSMITGEKVTTRLSPLFPSFQIYGFNKKSLLEALKKAGFKIFYVKIRGMFGGGRIKGKGLVNKVINLMRKIIILIDGMTGNGHLIYCLAEKREKR
ncbi:MAG: class I SAM-dependent methyltransferase [Candidatus Omnitrophota bacterium]|nr:MAG: class I SAM-dependent methyltransferase [Candidatus Omnitrophota bacterium]